MVVEAVVKFVHADMSMTVLILLHLHFNALCCKTM